MGGINLLQSNLNTKGPSETQLMGGNSLEGQQVRKEFSTKSLTLTFPTPTGPEYVVFEGTAQELSALEGRAQEIFQPQGVSVDMFSNGTIDGYLGSGGLGPNKTRTSSIQDFADAAWSAGGPNFFLNNPSLLTSLSGSSGSGGTDYSAQIAAINRAVSEENRARALRDSLASIDTRIANVGFDAQAAAMKAAYDRQKIEISQQRLYDQQGFAAQNFDLGTRKLDSNLEFGLDSIARTESRIESNFDFAQRDFDLANKGLLENEAFAGDDSDLANRSLDSRVDFLNESNDLSTERFGVLGSDLERNAGLQQAGVDISERGVSRGSSLQADPFRRFTSTVSGDAYQSKVRAYSESVRKARVADQIDQLDLARRNIEEQLAQAQSALDFQSAQQGLAHDDALKNVGFQREQAQLTLEKQLAQIARDKQAIIDREAKAEVDRILDLEDTAAKAEELKTNTGFQQEGLQLSLADQMSLIQAGLYTGNAGLDFANLQELMAEQRREQDLQTLQVARYNTMTDFGRDTGAIAAIREFQNAGGTNLYEFDYNSSAIVPAVPKSPLQTETDKVVSNLPTKPKAGYGADGIWRDPNARTTNVTPTFMNNSGVIRNLPTMQNAEYATPNPVARPEGVD